MILKKASIRVLEAGMVYITTCSAAEVLAMSFLVPRAHMRALFSCAARARDLIDTSCGVCDTEDIVLDPPHLVVFATREEYQLVNTRNTQKSALLSASSA